MDNADVGIEISDELYVAFAQQAAANQRTPEEELCAILTAAIEKASGDAS